MLARSVSWLAVGGLVIPLVQPGCTREDPRAHASVEPSTTSASAGTAPSEGAVRAIHREQEGGTSVDQPPPAEQRLFATWKEVEDLAFRKTTPSNIGFGARERILGALNDAKTDIDELVQRQIVSEGEASLSRTEFELLTLTVKRMYLGPKGVHFNTWRQPPPPSVTQRIAARLPGLTKVLEERMVNRRIVGRLIDAYEWDVAYLERERAKARAEGRPIFTKAQAKSFDEFKSRVNDLKGRP